MTLAALWVFLAVALPVLGALIADLSSVDLAYHLRAGSEILSTGAIPRVDSWTYTAAGLPWLDQQWGAQVLLAGVHGVGGWSGLAVLRALLVGLTFGLIFLACRRRGADTRVAAWLTLAAFLVSVATLALRPQLLGMALFALTLLIVVDRRAHPGRLWLVPLIALVWANLHGSFILAPIVLGLAWIEDIADGVPRPHRTLLVALVAAAATLVNPFGPGAWLYAAGITTSSLITSRISEWQPTTLRTPQGIAFFASALAIVALLARRGRPTPWPSLLWLAAFFVVGAYAVRGLAWWPLAAAVVVAGLLARPVEAAEVDADEPAAVEIPAESTPRAERPRRLPVAVAGLIVVACLVLLPFWRPIEPGLDAPVRVVGHAPPGITAELRRVAQPGDRLFAPQAWGSWFEFAQPELAVAVDSRIELFPLEVWDDYDIVSTGGPEWRSTLDGWGVNLVVVNALHQPGLAEALAADDDWQRTYEDADGAVYVRRAA